MGYEDIIKRNLNFKINAKQVMKSSINVNSDSLNIKISHFRLQRWMNLTT